MKSIFVWSILYYLRFWAKLALLIHHPRVIGITGSVGKSSARNTIYAMLKDNWPTKMIEKGNSETGIPLGILGLSPANYTLIDWFRLLFLLPFGLSYLHGIKFLIIEMGVDEPEAPKNMEYLLTIVQPEIAVFLNVWPVHTMQFEKGLLKEPDEKKRLTQILERIAEEKGKIFRRAKVCIYNADDTQIKNQNAKIPTSPKGFDGRGKITDQNSKMTGRKWLSFGKSNTDIIYQNYDLNLSSTSFNYIVKSAVTSLARSSVNPAEEPESISIKISGYLLPREYQEIFASALLVGQFLKMTLAEMKKNIEKNFYLPAGRATIFQGIDQSVIIDSSYNASRSSVIAFLRMVYQLKLEEKRPVVFVFGDMRELGDQSKNEHEIVVEEILKVVDFLYCVGPMTKKYVLPKMLDRAKSVMWFKNSKEAGEYLKNNLPEKAIVLVKGSQNTIFLEETVKYLLKDKADIARLCRQADFWMRKKQEVKF